MKIRERPSVWAPDTVEQLHALAIIALREDLAPDALTAAARLLRRATGAAEGVLVYATQDDFLRARDGVAPKNDLSSPGLLVVQRRLVQRGGPIAFNLCGERVTDVESVPPPGARTYLAFRIPATESSSELCLLRGRWSARKAACAAVVTEAALPALAVLMDRTLNADRSRRHRQQLEALNNAVEVLTRATDVREGLTDLLSAAAAATGFDYVTLDLYDGDQERFVLRALSRNRWANTALADFWIKSFNPNETDFFARAVMDSDQPLICPDLQRDERFPEVLRAFFRQALLVSCAVFAVRFQGELLGTMGFVSYRPRAYRPEEVDDLQGVTQQVATALKAMRMYAALARSRQELERYARRIERQQAKLRRQARRLRQMATTDALTGACNHRRLHEAFDRLLARARAEDAPVGVLLADIDDFKSLNDTYGHLVGDDALRAVGRALRLACRPGDVVGRYGGDEFMILAPGASREDAEGIAARLAERVSRIVVKGPRDVRIERIAVSIGAASYPADGLTKDQLIHCADAAMYEAKRARRGAPDVRLRRSA